MVVLVGHSLGCSAVLAAAQQLDPVKAVATIGAPAPANHAKHLVAGTERGSQRVDEAEVRIGARSLRVKQQLLQDLDRYCDLDHLRDLKRARWVFHSPVIGAQSSAPIKARQPRYIDGESTAS